MKPNYLNPSAINNFIHSALEEDVRSGDHSTLASVPKNIHKKAILLAKQSGVVAGIEIATEIFKYVDDSLNITSHFSEGSLIQQGDIIMAVEGNASAILTAERLVLNCMQRMSGIATYTNQVVKLLEDTATQLLDTRKTTPNFRIMEKWAVYIGGGTNHRFGLFDMIMLKDNHIDYAGSITKAVDSTVDYLQENSLDLKIEVETRNLDEVKEAVETRKVDIIMLDNMTTDQMKEAVSYIDGNCQTEASGNITETTIRQVAECGVDFISMGALTHSVKSLDISLKAEK